MKRVLILTLLALSACAHSARQEKTKAPQTESPYTEEAAMRCYAYEPEKALAILDSAQIAGNLTPFRADLLRARVYANTITEPNLQKALEISLRLLERQKDPEYDSAHMEILGQLVSIYRSWGDNWNMLHWSTRKADYCREIGEETEALRTEAEIGVILAHLGQKEEGLAKLDDAIRQLETPRQFARMDACIIAIKRKISVLMELGEPEEVLPLAKKIIAKMDDYQQHPQDYNDGSFRMPKGDEDRLDYCNFYRTQAYAFLAWAHASSGNTREARVYESLYEKTELGQSTTGRRTIASTWLLLGEYDKLLPFYEDLEKQMGGDTLNVNYAEVLKGRATISQAQGRFRESSEWWKRYALLSDELNNDLHQSEAHAYAAQYRLKEQELALQQSKSQATRRSMQARSAILLALLAAGFVIFLLRKNRVIEEKNGTLSRQITELLKIKAYPETPREESAPVSKTLSALSEAELFHMLETVIVSEKLYLNPALDRQMLMDRFHLSKERIGAAFSQGSSYHSLVDFLMEHRLYHGARLLIEQPDLPVQDVALQSGFASGNIFGRNFKQRFGLSPSEYRQQELR